MENDFAGHLLFAGGVIAFVGLLCGVLWTGEFTFRHGPTYTRKNDPIIYWIVTTFIAIIVVVFMPIAVSLFFEGSGTGPK